MRTSVMTTSGNRCSTSSSSDGAVAAVGDDLDIVLMPHNLVHGLTHQKRVIREDDADGASLGHGRVNYVSTLTARSRCLNQFPELWRTVGAPSWSSSAARPDRSMPLPPRNPRASAATWNISAGPHLVDSSRIREPSG